MFIICASPGSNAIYVLIFQRYHRRLPEIIADVPWKGEYLMLQTLLLSVRVLSKRTRLWIIDYNKKKIETSHSIY